LSQSEAAGMFNVSERMIRSVKAIEREAPELLQDIEARIGELLPSAEESQRAVVAAKVANIHHGGDRKSDQEANLPLDISQSEVAREWLREQMEGEWENIEHDKSIRLIWANKQSFSAAKSKDVGRDLIKKFLQDIGIEKTY
jgi:hypothetical protein